MRVFLVSILLPACLQPLIKDELVTPDDPDSGLTVDSDTPEPEPEPDPPAIVPPEGTVGFVYGDTCPEGWSRWERGEGRLLIGSSDTDTIGETVGTRWEVGEVRTHSHGWATSITVNNIGGVALLDSCCNEEPAQSGTVVITDMTAEADLNLPLIDQLACEKDPSDLPNIVGDPFPLGSIQFFDAEVCPDGWEDYKEASGRAILSVTEYTSLGTTVGDALDARYPVLHTHAFSASITVPEMSLIAIGGGNNAPGRNGTHSFTVTTDPADPDIPMRWTLVCEKTADHFRDDPDTIEEVVPDSLVAWFEEDICPDGWFPSAEHEGRFVTGMQIFGTPFDTRGEAMEAGETRLHNHVVQGTLPLGHRETAGGSGCCYGGIGRAGDHEFTTQSTQTDMGVPYVQLFACAKI